MTAPIGSIVFNNSTGSDTAASGLGPTTAVSGTGASLNTTSAVDLSADSPDLSGITAGMLLWVDTSSGRQFSIIASVDNGTKVVTCDDAFAVTESSRNWGIGGKRSSITAASNLFTTSIKAGWTVDIEYTGTDYAYSGTGVINLTQNGDADNGYIHITSSSGTKPTLSTTGNNTVIQSNARSFIRISNLKLVTNGDGSASCVSNYDGGAGWRNMIIENCECTRAGAHAGSGSGIVIGGNSCEQILIRNCYIHGLSANGIVFGNIGTSNRACVVENCRIKDNQLDGIDTTVNPIVVFECIITGNGAHGVDVNSIGSYRGSGVTIKNCIIHDNTFDGIQIADNDVLSNINISGNIIINNGEFGIELSEAATHDDYYINYNAFYQSNSYGEYDNLSAGSNDIILTGDPFVDALNGDFNLNDTAGAGAALRAVTITMP